MRMFRLLVLFVMLSAVAAADEPAMDAATVENFAGLALQCIHQEYPNKIGHVMNSDDDVGPPRELTPAFFGCFDWHSSIHGHWLLTRLSKLYPDAEFTAAAKAGLGQSLSAGTPGRRRRLSRRRGSGLLRATLRPGMVALSGRGAPHLGRRASAAVVGEPGAARGRGGEPHS